MNGISLNSDFLLTAQSRALSRRQFLRDAVSTGLGSRLLGVSPSAVPVSRKEPKIIVVTFGGGARDEETFAVEGQQFIPNLIGELIPQATFYTQVINRGILGHYVATASLATGCYESFNNFAPVSPANPTIFEYYRRDRRRPASDVWVIAPSNGFNHIGESGHRLYGRGLGASIVLPKQLLDGVRGDSGYQHLLHDSYESSLQLPGNDEVSLHALTEMLQLSLSDFTARARTLGSPDELSFYIAQHVMAKLAPNLMWITLHDIDIAHAGAFSLYTDAIANTDRICAQLWKLIQTDPNYKDNTYFFILPDFGRDSDTSPGGNGFQHHRTGDALSRTTWLMALGPGVRQNVTVNRPVESLDLVPTLAKLLNCTPRFAAGAPLSELV